MSGSSGTLPQVLPQEKLVYKVSKWSSYSSTYEPANILVDCPNDQASRWSSETNHPPQFLVLELEKPAIVSSISFGKYEKTHVCNLKQFKVYGGMSESSMVEMLEAGLKNDHIREHFMLKHTIDGNKFPCKFIKVVPLQSWGASFNFSIWHLELNGNANPELVNSSLDWYNQYREREAIRLCLKHFRQQHYVDAFEALQKRTKVSLEHPMLTEIYEQLVTKGDYEGCEAMIETAATSGLFSHFINQQEFEPCWTKIEPVNKDGTDQRPGRRGGHQMVIDPYAEIMYLFGGWDGESDLADFWSYHVPSQHWTCISQNTALEGGPSARSCHKMIMDYDRKQLFVLGRYVEQEYRTTESLKSAFYVYDLIQNRWTLITEDTYAIGGPRLLFDHQMAMDVRNQIIYVFGGKILTCLSEERYADSNFSGLYAYHIANSTWLKLKEDGGELKSRIGHSMLFNENNKKLYIFSGQRGKEFLGDFYTYDVENDVVHYLSDYHGINAITGAVPPTGYTQRATIDPERNIMHVLLGLRKNKEKNGGPIKNSLWIYDISKNSWSCLFNNPSNMSGGDHCEYCSDDEPVPRFAHQLVYDHVKKVHYMFGGNPGSSANKSERLDDFWSLCLCKPSEDHVLRKCKYLVRKYRFKEMAQTDSIQALQYLQTSLLDLINQSDSKEALEFQRLTMMLFEDILPEESSGSQPPNFKTRSELYNRLVEYFPSNMTQPPDNLVDLIHLE